MALSKITNASVADTAVHGRRNLIINGAMQLWQRGTSTTGLTGGNNFLVDRFKWKISTNGTWRIDQSTDTPNDSFKYSFKAECTTADTSIGNGDQLRLLTSLEGQDLVHLAYGSSAAKKTTLSFWIKCSKAATYAITLEAGSGRNYTVHYTVDTANTWEYKTITIAGDTSTALANQDNNAGITYSWWFGVGTSYDADETQDAWYTDTDYSGLTGGVTTNLADTVNANVYITGVQLEVGDKATPFEHRSYGEELALCQRYFFNLADGGSNDGGDIGTGTLFNSTVLMCAVNFPVTMRAQPTLDHATDTGGYRFWRNGTSDDFNGWTYWYDAHVNGGALQAESNISGTSGQGGRVVVLNSGSGYVHFDAEL